MDPEDDVESFVLERGTGGQIPDPPAFSNYRNPDAMPSGPMPPTTRPARFIRSTTRNIEQSRPPEEENRAGMEGVGHSVEDTDEAIIFGHSVELGTISTSVLQPISRDDGPNDPRLEDNLYHPLTSL